VLSGCLAKFEIGSSDGGSETLASTTGGSETAAQTETETGGNGECSEPCEDDESCVMGQCVAPCPVPCDATLEICDDGECVCRFGFTPCGGVCVDLLSDAMHCGECSEACDVGVCDEGSCEPDGCQESTDCNGSCVDLEHSPLHCGGCDEACDGDELCIEAECVGYQPTDCRSDLDCDAGVCCAIEGEDKICVDGDSCP
jgi:hypothetical protein